MVSQDTRSVHKKAFDTAVQNYPVQLEPGGKPWTLAEGFWYCGMAHGMRVGGEASAEAVTAAAISSMKVIGQRAMEEAFDEWRKDNSAYYGNESDGEGYDSRDDR